MSHLQQALLEENLLETIKEEFQHGYVYEIYPDEEQRQYIHRNCGCKRKLHNLFVDELYQFLFNDPDHIATSICYNYAEDVIYITKNILPDERFGTTHPRDIMSIACVLAHEYYGHRTYRNEYIADQKAGQPYGTTPAWQDECRANSKSDTDRTKRPNYGSDI